MPTADTRDMIVVHSMFRRELRLAPDLVRGVPDEDLRRARTVADHLTWVLGVLHHHHHGEDVHVWPLLLQRAAAELRPLVHTMEAQHAEIADLMAALEPEIETLRENPPAVRTPLAAHLEQLVAVLVQHLALEEAEVLPIAAQHMTQEEWARLAEFGLAGTPPKERPLVFGMFMHEGDPATIRSMLSQAPAPVRMLMPRIGPRVFARYARRVHGTATP